MNVSELSTPEGDEMWVVNPSLVMSIRHVGASKMFAAIWDQMDSSSQIKSQLVQVDSSDMKAILHKQVRWEALKYLEDLRIIKRWRSGSSWTTVMVNPEVVRPWWLKGWELDQAIAIFQNEPVSITKA